MQLRTFHQRSLWFHRRANAAVALGIVVASSALTGALVVGDSMRGSLRESALGRLGRVDHALQSHRYFRETLASDIAGAEGCLAGEVDVVPVVIVQGGVIHAGTGASAYRANLMGVDERFVALSSEVGASDSLLAEGRSVVLNEPLAEELGVVPGDSVIVRVGKPAAISSETLLGRRDDTTTSLRLTVRSIVPARGLGALGLEPKHALPKNAFIPLGTLQRALDQEGRVNAMLAARRNEVTEASGVGIGDWRDCLGATVGAVDLGLRLRVDTVHGYVALESEAMLVAPVAESAAREAASSMGVLASPIQTYLANEVRSLGGQDESPPTQAIPYSTVTAIDPASAAAAALTVTVGASATSLEPGRILLNQWAADDLSVRPGDRISLSYYVTGAFGALETRVEEFVLHGVVALEGRAADPGFTPEYKGVTDTDNLSDWDPPFPMELDLIRDKDEAYWDRYRTTPKAFITLADGLRLWSEDGERFGTLTAIQLAPSESGQDLGELSAAFERELLGRVDPGRLGFAFDAVRANALAAGAGSTDFGMLFVGFSSFLIASAGMLVALLFRLGVEQRAREIGLLLACGFSPRSVSGALLAQGAVLAAIGGAAGQVGAMGYAWLMLAGLRSWWSDAVNAPFLALHVSPVTIAVGFVASVVVALLSIGWSVRGLSRLHPRSLLAGVIASGRSSRADCGGRRAKNAAIVLFLAVMALTVAPLVFGDLPASILFFLSGAAMLMACVSVIAWRIQKRDGGVIEQFGRGVWFRLGVRNARRHLGRSLLTAGLVAAATFLIVALEAFRLEVGSSVQDRDSGTGGFTYYAESSVPLLYDLNSSAGREALNVTPSAGALYEDVTVMPFRLRPGDASGCTNLYRKNRPRILGATPAMVQRGGFVFSKTLAESALERENPWRLLDRRFEDGAIPVIGDEASVLWQLHLGLGKDLVIADDRGEEVRLRFVALLAGSVVQDELIVGESAFGRLFPSIAGYGFFMVEVPSARAERIERALERELAPFSLDVGSTSTRLAGYQAVQNTYLRTFQTLGGFGLVLGTIGLGAVLLRNVWERRGELALMQAVGFSERSLGLIVLGENLALLTAGLAAGFVSAMLAVAPHVVSRPGSLPWWSVGFTLASVFGTGLIAGMIGTALAFRSPLLPALRSE